MNGELGVEERRGGKKKERREKKHRLTPSLVR
jgi:hypothetical protein